MTNIKEYILSISTVEKAFVFLDSCNQPAALDYNVYDWMAAWGEKSVYAGDSFDELYTFQSIEKKWLDNWIKTNFKGGKKNKDLWLQYYQLAKDYKIKIKWVKGHADNIYNNRCDELATAAADSNNLLIDEGYEQTENS